jgi:thermitase
MPQWEIAMQSISQLLKKKWVSAIIVVLILFIISIVLLQSFQVKPEQRVFKKPFILTPGAEYVPDRLIVEFQKGKTLSDADVWKKLHGIGVTEYKKLFESEDPLLKNFYILTLKKGTDLKIAGEKVNSLDDVKTVDADYIAHTTAVPNDQYYSQQWHYKKIGMEQAWDTAKGSHSIIAAVLDTGVDYNHPDLPRDIIKGPDFTSADNDPIDRQGHGTHVSGTIGALTNNDPTNGVGKGVAGINWEVQLMIVQVLGDSGSGPSTAISQGMVWASDHGARVINMSLGGSGGCASVYQNAVTHAVNKGTVVVVAAGNDGRDAANYTPASCNGVITVGATNQSDARTSFSNYGSTVEIGAPGIDIVSTYKGGAYKSLAGTSMASPHVAGAVALLLSKKSSLTPQQVLDCLVRNGDAIQTDKPIGGKRLNMKKVLDDPACGGGNAPTNTPTPTVGSTPLPGSSPTPSTTPRPSPSLTPRPTATITPRPATPTQRPKRIVVRFRCFVFDDENQNGLADPGEKGIDGAEFTVFPKRTYSPTATTSSDGYCYLILIPGRYRIIVRIAGKIEALSEPFDINENEDEQTLSIGISDEPVIPVEPTASILPNTAYECRQPTISRTGKSLQLVNLQCTPK